MFNVATLDGMSQYQHSASTKSLVFTNRKMEKAKKLSFPVQSKNYQILVKSLQALWKYCKTFYCLKLRTLTFKNGKLYIS